MDPYLAEWLGLALRWAHLVVGIMWIGTSLYFMWLDSHLETPATPRPQVEGELWMVHSGGFYQVEKRLVGPGSMPKTLHWFKWEAALTLISGLLLLAVVYYLTGGVFLLDPRVSSIGVGTAVALGIGVLVGGWSVYDLLWLSPVGRRRPGLATFVSFVLLAAVVYALCRLLSGRAAYVHVGALLGTIMVANVWMRILPAQHQMIGATGEGKTPDFTLGRQAKYRSVHNSYMTFPVIFIMFSNHYPMTYGHPLNWLVLLLMIVLGGGLRHFMIVLDEGETRRPSGWAGLGLAAAALVAVLVLTAPRPQAATPAGAPVSFRTAQAVIILRCATCHSERPSDRTFGIAPGNVAFDTPEAIRRVADRIKARAVETETMPLGNKTGMTGEERRLLARWVEGGARLD